MVLRVLSWLAPFLVANQMPLFLYTGNIHIVVAAETYQAFVVATAGAALLVASAYALTRNRIKTVALACGVLAWFYWWSAFVRGVALVLDPVWATRVGLTLWTLLAALYVVLVLRARPRDPLVRVWVIVSIAILAMPILMVTRFVLFHAGRAPHVVLPAVELELPAQPPDIYYVIFDRYAGQATLREAYGFDNSEILDHLRARGFYVADRSHANYLRTGPSLVSSLNFEHLDELYASMNDVSDWRPLYARLRDHRVGQSLRRAGYELVNIGSWWEPSRHNPHASRNLARAPLPAFFLNAYEATTLWAAGLSFGGRLDARQVQWEQISRQVQALAAVGRRSGPLFVFAHLLLPHGPYVFGPNGEFLPREVVEKRTHTENYLDHVRFANTVIRNLVEILPGNGNGRRSVVIIQADEGPFPNRDGVETLPPNWRQASPDDLRQKFTILNALYLPEAAPGALYPTITPVNTFRVVFNTYFGTRLAMLPDTSFAAANDQRPFDLFEITGMLASLMRPEPPPAPGRPRLPAPASASKRWFPGGRLR